ncbi:MAG: F-type H+-transporting ATPase subunit gamma [Myxococcota bacterium]|jgi:F-type H+-transporting ATPase subunit gamma
MPSLSDIRRRITSVKNTRKITRAMKLVSSAKLKKAKDAAIAAQPYQQTLQRVLERVVSSVADIEHPLLTVPDNENDVLVVYIGSDRGLCGGFNSQLVKATTLQIKRLQSEGKTVRMIVYGRKGLVPFGNMDIELIDTHVNNVPAMFDGLTAELALDLVTRLNLNEFGTAYLAYNRFVTTMTQEPVLDQLLPMSVEAGDDAGSGDYLYEPSGQEILDDLLPMAMRTRVFQAFLDTEAGEQASRMTAMDNATRNAGEMIDKLTLQYNRARQAAITTELIEIISGAEAL